jgi:hypothetical protein
MISSAGVPTKIGSAATSGTTMRRRIFFAIPQEAALASSTTA